MLQQPLSALLSGLLDIHGNDPIISGLCTDSRIAKPGDLFIANKGTQSDGRLFIIDAIAHNVTAVVYEADDLTQAMQETITKYEHQLPMIALSDLDEKIGLIAQRFYQNPSKAMHIMGATGTNGKTSCAYFLTQAQELLGKKAAMMGTIGIGPSHALKESTHTTLCALPLQQHLYELAQEQFHYINMEVSSHALSQHRVSGVPFEVALFTNLTLDHLDYHHTMEEYGKAKLKLFKWESLKYAVINLDDEFSENVINTISDNVKIIGVSLRGRTHIRCAQILTADHIELSADQTCAQINGHAFKTAILGEFNLSNLLLVQGALIAFGFSFNDSIKVLSQLHEPPGRLTKIGGNGKPFVFIDYAHTPDALEKVLTVLKPLCKGQLWCVFGCGGDRDNSKRSLMANIAQTYADKVIVTDDNPRTEDPKQIVQQMMQGFKNPETVTIEHDRSKAIEYAIKNALPNDFVLIAGKGHEDYQIIGTHKHSLSDLKIAKESLQNLT
ncbi:MAG: UDP-N-acetylmuramoyl-L-alanyl-D-glutamate--2,6-diaminopimelate ligase [Legionellales bacterium]|jgi:UDP-N-acetylmuramoyl-L-alanyl-D-glutamate--2,6-diaminopimelate ligase